MRSVASGCFNEPVLFIERLCLRVLLEGKELKAFWRMQPGHFQKLAANAFALISNMHVELLDFSIDLNHAASYRAGWRVDGYCHLPGGVSGKELQLVAQVIESVLALYRHGFLKRLPYHFHSLQAVFRPVGNYLNGLLGQSAVSVIGWLNAGFIET